MSEGYVVLLWRFFCQSCIQPNSKTPRENVDICLCCFFNSPAHVCLQEDCVGGYWRDFANVAKLSMNIFSCIVERIILDKNNSNAFAAQKTLTLHVVY